MPKPGDLIIAGFEFIMLDHASRAVGPDADNLPPREGGGRAISAIVLAAAAVEAHVGQWAALFEEPAGITDMERKQWRGLGFPELVKAILRSKAGLDDVRHLDWFPKLCALHRARTHITHYFPEWAPPGTWPSELLGLVSGKLITPAGDETMHWTSRLYTPAIARDLIGYGREAIVGFDKAVGWAA